MSNKLKSKQGQKSLKWTIGREFTAYLLDLLICIYMLLIIVVMPFYYQEGFAHIGTDKATFFRQVSIVTGSFILPVLAIFWFFRIMEDRKIKLKLSVTDRFALLYGASLLLSYLGSSYQENALWGTRGWFMGLLPQLFFLAAYFLISRFWEVRGWLLFLFLPVSAVVFVLGYLNRFGIFPLDMQLENVQFISTIGNINWYCGYLVSVFFGGCYLLWQSDELREKVNTWKRLFLILYVAIGFATLVTQGSMSGVFTLVVMLIVLFCMSAKNSGRMLLFWQQFLLLSVVCLLTFVGRRILGWQITYTDSIVDLLTYSPLPIVMTLVAAGFVGVISYLEKRKKYPTDLFGGLAKLLPFCAVAGMGILIIMIVVNTLRPGSLGGLSAVSLFTFSGTWGSNRGITWSAGLMCFGEQDLLHKLLGVGPDCMSVYLDEGAGLKLQQKVAKVFGTDLLTNAHNEWITVLVNTGLVGCVGFVGMMVSAIWRYLKKGLAGACGFCLLAYTINNMFSFQQSMSMATIFIILGVGEALTRQKPKSGM